MMTFHSRSVLLPNNTSHPPGTGSAVVLKGRTLVIIGANGAGKTRLGAWLDTTNHHNHIHHRISAHRSLVFPESVAATDLKRATDNVLYGAVGDHVNAQYKAGSRWGGDPAINVLSDYAALVTALVSDENVESTKYRQESKSSGKYVEPRKTRLDVVKEIWETVLPERELLTTGTSIHTRNRGTGSSYHARNMSDGERSIFHLIAESMFVPKDGMLIVDEPELHLHRAILAKLWDAIELARPDCVFVYITHDLGFATSRTNATKVWLREFNGHDWDWAVLPDDAELPEPLLLEVMGSRHPILFTEGEAGSHDPFIYGRVYPHLTVIPCGSCGTVIHSTRAFKRLSSLHHNYCHGLIDNDGRLPSEIQYLNEIGVDVLPVALVENIFLIESIVRLAATKMSRDAETTFSEVKARVLGELRKNRVKVVSNLTRREIEVNLAAIGGSPDGEGNIDTAFKAAIGRTDPRTIFQKWDAVIENVLAAQDYAQSLQYYKIKGLSRIAADVPLGLKNYEEQIKLWMASEWSEEFVAAFRSVLPKL